MRGLSLVLSMSLFLQACATAYKGPVPDFKLTGNAAREEAERFTLNESHHFEWRGAWFEMGPQNDWYTVSSLKPIIEPVSPEAAKTLARARRWRTAQYAAAGLALAAAGVALTAENKYNAYSALTVAFLSAGTSYGIGFVYDSLLSTAASEFNRDMRRSFTPALGMNWQF